MSVAVILGATQQIFLHHINKAHKLSSLDLLRIKIVAFSYVKV